MNEIIDSQSKRGYVRPTERVNILPDTRILDIDNQKTDKSNITSDNYTQVHLSFSAYFCEIVILWLASIVKKYYILTKLKLLSDENEQ